MPPKQLTAARLSDQDIQRLDTLTRLLDTTRTDVIRRGIEALAREHGVLAGETAQRVRDLIDRQPDAEVALAVQVSTSNVPVSIGGQPTDELVAARWLRPFAEDEEAEDGHLALPAPQPVSLWIPDTSPRIKFHVDDVRPGTTLMFPISELWTRWAIEREQSAESIRSNKAIRRAAGRELGDDEQEDMPLDD